MTDLLTARGLRGGAPDPLPDLADEQAELLAFWLQERGYRVDQAGSTGALPTAVVRALRNCVAYWPSGLNDDLQERTWQEAVAVLEAYDRGEVDTTLIAPVPGLDDIARSDRIREAALRMAVEYVAELTGDNAVVLAELFRKFLMGESDGSR